MKIVFERTGGFAGRKIRTSFDASSLPPAQAHLLGKLLEQSRFFELPSKLSAMNTGADRFNYKVTVESESGSHTVEAAESAIPANLRPLLNWLSRSVPVKTN